MWEGKTTGSCCLFQRFSDIAHPLCHKDSEVQSPFVRRWRRRGRGERYSGRRAESLFNGNRSTGVIFAVLEDQCEQGRKRLSDSRWDEGSCSVLRRRSRQWERQREKRYEEGLLDSHVSVLLIVDDEEEEDRALGDLFSDSKSDCIVVAMRTWFWKHKGQGFGNSLLRSIYCPEVHILVSQSTGSLVVVTWEMIFALKALCWELLQPWKLWIMQSYMPALLDSINSEDKGSFRTDIWDSNERHIVKLYSGFRSGLSTQTWLKDNETCFICVRLTISK